MRKEKQTAAPMGSIIGNGGSVVSKAVASGTYHQNLPIATETYPVLVIANRFGLPVALAGEVVRMAGIGVRLG